MLDQKFVCSLEMVTAEKAVVGRERARVSALENKVYGVSNK